MDKVKLYILLSIFQFIVIRAISQCPGFQNPSGGSGASTNVTVLGSTPWEYTYPAVQTSDNSYVNMRPNTVATSHYLSVYNWGYNFSATATICGITVRVEKVAPATNTGTITDLEARLYQSTIGTSPNNYADAVTPWSSTDTYITYGGPMDLWGYASIPVSAINGNTATTWFQFRFRAQRTVNADSAKIDHVALTAHADELLPVELLLFDAQKNIHNRSVLIRWECATEFNNAFFKLERSKDMEEWETIAIIEGAGNSSILTKYEFQDNEPFPGTSYYRLSQTDFDGTTKFLDFLVIRFKDLLGEMAVYPTFANEVVKIKAQTDLYNSTVLIYNVTGKLEKELFIAGNGGHEMTIPIDELPSGLYFIKLTFGNTVLSSKFIKL